MNIATEEMFNDLLSTAKILVEAPNNINWDLGHYIADNVIGKIMMLKLHEEKGYSESTVQNYSFPNLVDEFKSQFPSILVDYVEIKSQHSRGRNPFQHRLITNYLGIRQSQAKLYIHICHELLEKIGLFNPKPDYSIITSTEGYTYPLDKKSEIQFFIERLKDKDYISILNRFYDPDFEDIFQKLFTEIDMETGYIALQSNSFVLVIQVDHINTVEPLFQQKEKYRLSWDNITMPERVNIFIDDFKERVKLIYGFDL